MEMESQQGLTDATGATTTAAAAAEAPRGGKRGVVSGTEDAGESREGPSEEGRPGPPSVSGSGASVRSQGSVGGEGQAVAEASAASSSRSAASGKSTARSLAPKAVAGQDSAIPSTSRTLTEADETEEEAQSEKGSAAAGSVDKGSVGSTEGPATARTLDAAAQSEAAEASEEEAAAPTSGQEQGEEELFNFGPKAAKPRVTEEEEEGAAGDDKSDSDSDPSDYEEEEHNAAEAEELKNFIREIEETSAARRQSLVATESSPAESPAPTESSTTSKAEPTETAAEQKPSPRVQVPTTSKPVVERSEASPTRKSETELRQEFEMQRLLKQASSSLFSSSEDLALLRAEQAAAAAAAAELEAEGAAASSKPVPLTVRAPSTTSLRKTLSKQQFDFHDYAFPPGELVQDLLTEEDDAAVEPGSIDSLQFRGASTALGFSYRRSSISQPPSPRERLASAPSASSPPKSAAPQKAKEVDDIPRAVSPVSFSSSETSSIDSDEEDAEGGEAATVGDVEAAAAVRNQPGVSPSKWDASMGFSGAEPSGETTVSEYLFSNIGVGTRLRQQLSPPSPIQREEADEAAGVQQDEGGQHMPQPERRTVRSQKTTLQQLRAIGAPILPIDEILDSIDTQREEGGATAEALLDDGSARLEEAKAAEWRAGKTSKPALHPALQYSKDGRINFDIPDDSSDDEEEGVVEEDVAQVTEEDVGIGNAESSTATAPKKGSPGRPTLPTHHDGSREAEPNRGAPGAADPQLGSLKARAPHSEPGKATAVHRPGTYLPPPSPIHVAGEADEALRLERSPRSSGSLPTPSPTSSIKAVHHHSSHFNLLEEDTNTQWSEHSSHSYHDPELLGGSTDLPDSLDNTWESDLRQQHYPQGVRQPSKPPKVPSSSKLVVFSPGIASHRSEAPVVGYADADLNKELKEAGIDSKYFMRSKEAKLQPQKVTKSSEQLLAKTGRVIDRPKLDSSALRLEGSLASAGSVASWQGSRAASPDARGQGTALIVSLEGAAAAQQHQAEASARRQRSRARDADYLGRPLHMTGDDRQQLLSKSQLKNEVPPSSVEAAERHKQRQAAARRFGPGQHAATLRQLASTAPAAPIGDADVRHILAGTGPHVVSPHDLGLWPELRPKDPFHKEYSRSSEYLAPSPLPSAALSLLEPGSPPMQQQDLDRLLSEMEGMSVAQDSIGGGQEGISPTTDQLMTAAMPSVMSSTDDAGGAGGLGSPGPRAEISAVPTLVLDSEGGGQEGLDSAHATAHNTPSATPRSRSTTAATAWQRQHEAAEAEGETEEGIQGSLPSATPWVRAVLEAKDSGPSLAPPRWTSSSAQLLSSVAAQGSQRRVGGKVPGTVFKGTQGLGGPPLPFVPAVELLEDSSSALSDDFSRLSTTLGDDSLRSHSASQPQLRPSSSERSLRPVKPPPPFVLQERERAEVARAKAAAAAAVTASVQSLGVVGAGVNRRSLPALRRPASASRAVHSSSALKRTLLGGLSALSPHWGSSDNMEPLRAAAAGAGSHAKALKEVLTPRQMSRVWNDFSGAEQPEAVRKAYEVLYPGLYGPPAPDPEPQPQPTDSLQLRRRSRPRSRPSSVPEGKEKRIAAKATAAEQRMQGLSEQSTEVAVGLVGSSATETALSGQSSLSSGHQLREAVAEGTPPSAEEEAVAVPPSPLSPSGSARSITAADSRQPSPLPSARQPSTSEAEGAADVAVSQEGEGVKAEVPVAVQQSPEGLKETTVEAEQPLTEGPSQGRIEEGQDKEGEAPSKPEGAGQGVPAVTPTTPRNQGNHDEQPEAAPAQALAEIPDDAAEGETGVEDVRDSKEEEDKQHEEEGAVEEGATPYHADEAEVERPERPEPPQQLHEDDKGEGKEDAQEGGKEHPAAKESGAAGPPTTVAADVAEEGGGNVKVEEGSKEGSASAQPQANEEDSKEGGETVAEEGNNTEEGSVPDDGKAPAATAATGEAIEKETTEPSQSEEETAMEDQQPGMQLESTPKEGPSTASLPIEPAAGESNEEKREAKAEDEDSAASTDDKVVPPSGTTSEEQPPPNPATEAKEDGSSAETAEAADKPEAPWEMLGRDPSLRRQIQKKMLYVRGGRGVRPKVAAELGGSKYMNLHGEDSEALDKQYEIQRRRATYGSSKKG